MNVTTRRITYAIGEIVLLAILAFLPFALVYIDVVVFGHGVGESSVTEITQEILLLMTVLIYWYGAWRHPNSRGFLMLVAGFFSCAFIRELDSIFDAVWHGFWFWPTLMVALTTISYVLLRCRSSVIGPMSNVIGTRPYFYIIIGLVTLLVFSRTFGSGDLLWKDLMGVAYKHSFKSALQEGFELFGYLQIAYGSGVFFFKRFDS